MGADMGDVQYPHDDAMVVTAGIANHNIHHVLIDNGSSVNIFSRAAYDHMGILNDKLRPLPMSFYGFLGQSVTPKRSIELPLTIRTPPR